MESKIKCRFKVERDLCIAVSACIVAAPDVYLLDDEAKAVIKPLELDDIKEIMREKEGEDEWVTVEASETGFNQILESAQVCPVLAIIVERMENEVWVRVYPE